jgi:hypothetical protein
MLEYLHLYNALAGRHFTYKIGEKVQTITFEDTHSINPGLNNILEAIWCLKSFNHEVFLFMMGITGTSLKYTFKSIAFFNLKDEKWVGKSLVEKLPVELIPDS